MQITLKLGSLLTNEFNFKKDYKMVAFWQLDAKWWEIEML